MIIASWNSTRNYREREEVLMNGEEGRKEKGECESTSREEKNHIAT